MPPNTLNPPVTTTVATASSSINSIAAEKRKTREEKNVKKILYDGQYYEVTDWVKRHPGGRIIDYYTESGEDATLAIRQFHFRSQAKVMGIMRQLKILGPDTSPSVSLEDDENDLQRRKRHADLTLDFTKLHDELEAEGFFEPCLWHLAYRIVEILLLAIVGLDLIKTGETRMIHAVGIFLFSISMGKCGWLQHEGGHGSLTGNRRIDVFIQTLAFGLAKGMSSTWWTTQHSRHHAMPNRLQRDVDLDTLPLLAFNSKVLDKKSEENNNNGGGGGGGSKKFLILHQAFLFLTVDTMLVGLFWKFYLHPRYAFKKKKYMDLTFMALSYYMLYFLGFWDYMTSIWVISIYLFGNFSLSHTHLPVTEGPLHWVEYGLLHTQDIDSKWCPWLVDWWMGYLNCQIEHHLFPTMPQFRNRRVKERVKALAAKHNIPYLCTSYGDAVLKTFQNLHHVANHHDKTA